MIKKTTLFLILGFILIFKAFSLDTDEKQDRWMNLLIKQSMPNSRLQGSRTFNEFASTKDAELALSAIQNINAHLMEVANLRAQGWTQQEIGTQFEQNLTHTQIGTGSISGKLTEKGGRTIKHFASVYAYNEFGRYCGYAFVSTYSEKNYKISNLQPGKYYIRVSSPYYQSKYYRNTADWRKAKKVRVTKYRETRNINFKLDYISEEKGDSSISGRVRRKDGTPIMNCKIEVYNLNYNHKASSTTDANGEYSTVNLPAGDYKIKCSYEDPAVYPPIWYGNVYQFTEASIVTIADSEAIENINFVLDYGGTIKVKVLGADGKPLKGYMCGLRAYDMNERLIQSGNTDDKGKCTFAALPKGRYKLVARYYGQENFIDSWYKNAKKFKSATPIRVNPLQTKNITLKLRKGGIIRGKVTGSNGQPISVSCEIKAYDDNGHYVKYGQTDEDGDFQVQGLETGRYKLYADVYNYPLVGSPQPVSEWYNDKSTFRDASFIKVKVSKTISNINFSLSQGGYITCRVLDPLGIIPYTYDTYVRAYNSRGEIVSSASIMDYNGLFALNGLPSGEYRVRAVYSGDEGYLSEFYDNKGLFEVADEITVTAPNGAGNITIELDYPGIFQGFLTDVKKKRVIDDKNHPVQIYAFDAETGECADFTDNTFMSGYHLEIIEGKYKLAVLSFYYNWMTGDDDYGVTYHPNGKKFNDPATKTHTAKSGTAKKLVSLALDKPKGSISGTVYDNNSGLAITEGLYFILVFDTDGYMVGLSGYLDSNNPITGSYRVGGIRPGNYYILATAASEFSDPYDIQWEWYGGVEMQPDELYNLTPKVDIPTGATPVSVGTGPTTGINFYLDIK